MVPQITGGLPPDTPVIEKVSVWHWVIELTPVPPAAVTLPPDTYIRVEVSVLGPAITNVLKSMRS